MVIKRDGMHEEEIHKMNISKKTIFITIYWFCLLSMTYYLMSVASKWGQDSYVENAVSKSVMKALNSPKPGEPLRVLSDTKFSNKGCELSLATYYVGEDEVLSVGYIKHDEVFLSAVENEGGVELEFRTFTNMRPGKYRMLVRGQYQCNMLQRLFPTTFSMPFVHFVVAENDKRKIK